MRATLPCRCASQDPSSLDELKGVLAVVSCVHTDSMGVELTTTDLEERCRTRLLYAVSPFAPASSQGRRQCSGLLPPCQLRLAWSLARQSLRLLTSTPAGLVWPAQVGEAAAAQAKADYDDVCRIAGEWRELAEEAERRDGELAGVKARFRETTRQEVRPVQGGRVSARDAWRPNT